MRPWSDVRPRLSPAVEAAYRAARRRARPPREGRYVHLHRWVMLPGFYAAGLIRPRLATSVDVYLTAILILLACEPVFVPGWLRPSLWWRAAGELLAGLSAGPAGSRWRHLRCRCRGHPDGDGDEYWTCPRHGRLEPGAVVDLATDRTCVFEVHAEIGCGESVTHVPAPSCCTVCGDPLSPGPGAA